MLSRGIPRSLLLLSILDKKNDFFRLGVRNVGMESSAGDFFHHLQPPLKMTIKTSR
jgi:hypothetical protein